MISNDLCRFFKIIIIIIAIILITMMLSIIIIIIIILILNMRMRVILLIIRSANQGCVTREKMRKTQADESADLQAIVRQHAKEGCLETIILASFRPSALTALV